MEKKEYLNEENYQKNKKKISVLALIVLIIGLLIGVILIAIGVTRQNEVNSEYSEENKNNLSEQLSKEKIKLETKKASLEAKGIEFDSFAKYTDEEVYDLFVITNVLDPSFDYCHFDEYKNNSLTSEYCSLKNQLEDASDNFNKSLDNQKYIPFYIFSAFIIIATLMISGFIYTITKRREIMAFSVQQTMPIAKEGIEKMAPTIGNAAGVIAKGIKDGLKDDEK